MAEVGSAFVSILPSAKGFGKKLEGQVTPETKKSGSKIGASLGKAFVAAGGAIAAVGFVKGAIGEAREAQKVGALTAQVIKSTGGAANVTAKQVANLSGAISSKTGIDDEAIQSGANMLLTFKNLRNEAGKGNDIFNQSTQTLTDMAAALGKDPKNAAIQLGKALNDPVKGISALSRVGVTFTEGQKKTIKSLVAGGKTMDAQKIILKELNSEFGGAAEAQATAGDKAKVAFQNLQETVGTALLPVLDKFANIFSTKIAPAVTKFVTGMQQGTGAGGKFAAIMSGIGSAIGTVFGFLQAHQQTITTFVAVLLTIVGAIRIWIGVQAALNFVLTANPIGLVVVAIAALVTGLIIAYKRSETFRNIVNGAFKAVVAAGKFMWGALKGYFKFIINMWLTVAGAIIHGAAKAFGWIPGIGGKIKALAKTFDHFRDDVNKSLNGIHDKHIKVTADTGAASAALAGIQRQFNALDGAHASVSVGVKGGIGSNAKGTNNWRGGLTAINEGGPEIVDLPKHTRIIPAALSRKIAASGSGGGPAVVNIYDVDGVLMGTMRGQVAAHAGVRREAARARR